jgi:hypothetical protein
VGPIPPPIWEGIGKLLEIKGLGCVRERGGEMEIMDSKFIENLRQCVKITREF